VTDLAGWVAPPFPERVVLDGRHVRLEPLDVARHAADIWRFVGGVPEIWTYLPTPMPADAAEYARVLDEMSVRSDIVPYAVIDKADGHAKGHLWLMEIRPEHGVFEVGFITYGPALQKTRAASAAIYLCGQYGFQLGYRRFEWKCNDRNEPSKRAALRYGFTPEGVFRQHMVVKGRNRDTAWFSILDHQWPMRRAAFEAWLDPANFDADGWQRLPLGAFGALRLGPLRRASMADRAAIEAMQQRAYAPNATIIGGTPLPLGWDYGAVLRDREVWLAEHAGSLDGLLILHRRADDLYVENVSAAPDAQGAGLGNSLLAAAEARARALGRTTLRLVTAERMTRNVDWYGRHGYAAEHREVLVDRTLVHMIKTIEG